MSVGLHVYILMLQFFSYVNMNIVPWMYVLTQGDKHAIVSTCRPSKREGGMVSQTKMVIRLEEKGQLPSWQWPKVYSEFDMVM